MALSNELISQFAKITTEKEETKTEEIVYGTTVSYNDTVYVKLDGSDRLTPITSTTVVKPDERVTVMIKDHSAIVTGNLSSPSARNSDVEELGTKISEFNTIVANKVDTEELNATNARIDTLNTDTVNIRKDLNAANANIETLTADNVTINETLSAQSASIDNLEATKISAEVADAKYATIENLEATNVSVNNLSSTYAEFKSTTTTKLAAVDASIENLETNKLSAASADLKYANIDFSNIGQAAIETFYSKSGIIKNLTIEGGTITGELVGVTIKGDLIEGGTVVADKLVVKGENGLYYKLNTDGVTTEAQQTEYNSLNGSVITAKSITATKISVTDLVAFDATIGGFNITENSIYSGVKESASNTTRGIYLDNDGQAVFGDASNYLKYYKDTDNSYKLAISASSIYLSASNKDVGMMVAEANDNATSAKNAIDNLEIGGRNLVIKKGAVSGRTDANSGAIMSASDHQTTDFVPIEAGIYTISGTNLLEANGKYITVAIYDSNKIFIKRLVPIKNIDADTYIETGDAPAETAYTRISFPTGYSDRIKLERGNKATDWTPAPEDMATAEEVSNVQSIADNAQSTADSNEERVTAAESAIQQLSDSISMLVTDGNGTSLMMQTENGWTFSVANIQNAVDSASENIDTLNQELGDVNSTVNVLQQAVNDLGEIADYVEIKVYEGEPCIELGESDSDFKLMITNTRIMFKVGSDVPTYIHNKGLATENIEVENELRQGGFVWKIRSNGNLGLIWKGVDE